MIWNVGWPLAFLMVNIDLHICFWTEPIGMWTGQNTVILAIELGRQPQHQSNGRFNLITALPSISMRSIVKVSSRILSILVALNSIWSVLVRTSNLLTTNEMPLFPSIDCFTSNWSTLFRHPRANWIFGMLDESFIFRYTNRNNRNTVNAFILI